MTYLPPDIVRPVYLENVRTPAIVLPFKYGEPFFVFEGEEHPIALFIGNEHRFHTMPAVSNTNWRGLAVEGLEVEVDLSSSYSLEDRNLLAGSLIRVADRLELAVIDGDYFGRLRRYRVSEGLAVGGDRLAVAFSRWKVVLRRDDRLLFEYEISAEPV